MHSLYEKISQSVLGFMPFLCVCVILQEKNPPLQSALGIQYWKKLFPAERIRGMLSQRNFQALCLYYYQKFIFNQDKVVLFSSKQMISSSLSSLLLLRNLLFVSARHRLSSLCKLLPEPSQQPCEIG